MKKRDHDLLDYELRVDRMLKKIRRQCYGLDTPLLAVLPVRLSQMLSPS